MSTRTDRFRRHDAAHTDDRTTDPVRDGPDDGDGIGCERAILPAGGSRPEVSRAEGARFGALRPRHAEAR